MDWHFWVTTLITAAIGAGAWVLAFQQLRINKNLSSQQLRLSHAKLQFDLYERRLALFSTVKKFAVRVSQTEGDVDTLAFYRETIEVRFLFDEDVVEYIVEMHKRAKRIKFLQTATDLDRESRTQEINGELEWFYLQQRNVIAVFSKDLSIKKLESPDSF